MLFFYEVEWGARVLQDGVEDVYMFMDDPEGDSFIEWTELPTGVVTILTRCYSASCYNLGLGCYAYGCPRNLKVSIYFSHSLSCFFDCV
jgi:hypothetical protein